MNGFTFLLSGTTVVKEDDGRVISSSRLRIGQKVEVRWVRRSDGALIATQIEEED